MELVKQSEEFAIYKKRSGRYAVKKAKTWVNGEDKTKILLGEGLIKVSAPNPEKKADAEAPAE